MLEVGVVKDGRLDGAVPDVFRDFFQQAAERRKQGLVSAQRLAQILFVPLLPVAGLVSDVHPQAGLPAKVEQADDRLVAADEMRGAMLAGGKGVAAPPQIQLAAED